MLYQTHHPLLFQFYPFATSTPHLASTLSLPSLSLFSYLPILQAATEMECVEAALKSSFQKDMALKFSPQAFVEELSVFNVQNVTPCDDFFVDELLDFSHEEAFVEEQPEEEHKSGSVSVFLPEENPIHEICNSATSYSVKDDFGCVPTSELIVPADDVADLEWLSHFVEDTFSEHSATAYPTETSTDKPKTHVDKVLKPESPVSTETCFRTPVPAKARSKRTRNGVRVWPLGSPPFAESSSSSTSSSSSSSPSTPWLIYTSNPQNIEQVCWEAKPLAKKPKKNPVSDAAGNGASQTPRRCSHCGVQKTPQWRTGPLGAKTLCNACGVRYKSGRLLPEYRPASSPTFSSELHSNHHRKVLEMRRKKESMVGIESGLAPPPVVPSF